MPRLSANKTLKRLLVLALSFENEKLVLGYMTGVGVNSRSGLPNETSKSSRLMLPLIHIAAICGVDIQLNFKFL